jgi:hypothetical protein
MPPTQEDGDRKDCSPGDSAHSLTPAIERFSVPGSMIDPGAIKQRYQGASHGRNQSLLAGFHGECLAIANRDDPAWLHHTCSEQEVFSLGRRDQICLEFDCKNRSRPPASVRKPHSRTTNRARPQ